LNGRRYSSAIKSERNQPRATVKILSGRRRNPRKFPSESNRVALLFHFFPLLTGTVQAQQVGPLISNNYNYVQPGLPGYGIAQGSIFVVAGAPVSMTTSTASEGVPLLTALAGVAIAITVGGVITQAIPYYVSPSQINAILPSDTPLGAATVTVTSAGKSVSGTTVVVPSSFGLATLLPPQGGAVPWAAALAQDDSEGGRLLSQTNAANPGEYLNTISGADEPHEYTCRGNDRRTGRSRYLSGPINLSRPRPNQRGRPCGCIRLQRFRSSCRQEAFLAILRRFQ
jgi:hypothetical protein